MNINDDSKMNKVSSPIKSSAKEESILKMQSAESGVKSVELDDFFEFLDEKTVQKIMETPVESKSRITDDIVQMEYETNGAKAILDSLG